MAKDKIIIYQANDQSTVLEVRVEDETVWLNRNQIALLFARDIKTIGKHINNVLKEELRDFSVIAKFATTASDGKIYQVEYYNLDRNDKKTHLIHHTHFKSSQQHNLEPFES